MPYPLSIPRTSGNRYGSQPTQNSLRPAHSGCTVLAMAPRLHIEILGPVRVELDGAPLVVDTRKAIALLAYLAVTGRPASRETVAALLWPESGESGAHGALRRTLSVLKTALG